MINNQEFTNLHEEILQFLYSKYKEDNSFLFRLRATNHHQKLDKKHWFIGNDGYLTITFWAKNDPERRRPYIRFNILPYDNCVSYDLISKSSSSLRAFFDNVAREVDIPIKPNLDFEWHKIFEVQDGNYLKELETFIENEKKIIDKRLKEAIQKNTDLENLDFIEKRDFDKWIKNINTYRTNKLK